MASGRALSTAATSDSGSRMSAACHPAMAGVAGGGPRAAPWTRRPLATSAFARWGPTKPLAPVSRTVAAFNGALPAGRQEDAANAALSPRAPVLQHVAQRLLERDRGLPAGHAHELGVVADQHRDVAGTEPSRILAHLDFRFRHAEQHVEHLADAPRLAARDVVRLPRLALLEGQPV